MEDPIALAIRGLGRSGQVLLTDSTRALLSSLTGEAETICEETTLLALAMRGEALNVDQHNTRTFLKAAAHHTPPTRQMPVPVQLGNMWRLTGAIEADRVPWLWPSKARLSSAQLRETLTVLERLLTNGESQMAEHTDKLRARAERELRSSDPDQRATGRAYAQVLGLAAGATWGHARVTWPGQGRGHRPGELAAVWGPMRRSGTQRAGQVLLSMHSDGTGFGLTDVHWS